MIVSSVKRFYYDLLRIEDPADDVNYEILYKFFMWMEILQQSNDYYDNHLATRIIEDMYDTTVIPRYNVILRLAALRYSLPYKDKVTKWNRLREEVKSDLVRLNGEEVTNELMKGFI